MKDEFFVDKGILNSLEKIVEVITEYPLDYYESTKSRMWIDKERITLMGVKDFTQRKGFLSLLDEYNLDEKELVTLLYYLEENSNEELVNKIYFNRPDLFEGESNLDLNNYLVKEHVPLFGNSYPFEIWEGLGENSHLN